MYMNKKRNHQLLLTLITGLTSYAVSSGTMGSIEVNPWSYVVAISAGPTWIGGGQTQTVFLDPAIEKTFTADNTSNVLGDGELFLGIQKIFPSGFEGQFGIEFAATDDARISGGIWEDGNPVFNDFNYGYQVNHYHIAAKGKLMKDMNFFVKPYVSVGLGIGFNRAHGFTQIPLEFEAIPVPNFTSNSTTTFTYTIGAGVQRELTKNVQVGVGYEFADWGKSQLGQAPGQTAGTGLVNNHLYTNGLMFNITYIA